MQTGTLAGRRSWPAGSARNVIHRADLGDLTADAIAHLRGVAVQHGVAFVRGFGTDPDDLAAVATSLGELQLHPLSELTGATSAISEIEDSAERPPAGFPWHTDLSWLPRPPRFGVLQALVVPRTGGDTMWVDLRRVHDRLPRALQRLCREVDLVHDASGLAASIERTRGAATADAFRSRFGPVTHPLVRAHPDDASPVLALCPMYATTVSGLDPSRSSELLCALHERLDDAATLTRWQWTAGDLVVWDESSTVHRALTDHHPALRRVRRCVTRGGDVVAFRSVSPS